MKMLCAVLVVAAQLLITTVARAQDCVRIEANKPLGFEGAQPFLAPSAAARVVIHLPDANRNSVVTEVVRSEGNPGVVPGKPYLPPAEFVSRAKSKLESMESDRRRSYRLAYTDASGVLQTANGGHPFYLAASEGSAEKKRAACADAEAAGNPGGVGGSGAAAPRTATPNQCRDVASRPEFARGPYSATLVFDSTGAVCYAPYPIAQRDRLNFVMVWNAGETVRPGVSANVTNCKVPTPGPVIYSSGDIPEQLVKQAARTASAPFEYQAIGLPVECASEAPQVTVSIPQDSGADKQKNHTLALFGRYTGVFHVGVLSSKLRDPDFGLRTLNGQTTIVDKEAQKRGPEYVAMVVVQAIPRYFMSNNGMSYPGRDLLHENDPIDRVGLAFSFGLKNPARRFGLGLSYEIARGINVAAVHEWVKRDRLDGVSVGESFSGAVGDIPVRKEWDRGWSFGLTFDIDYVAKAFGGGRK